MIESVEMEDSLRRHRSELRLLISTRLVHAPASWCHHTATTFAALFLSRQDMEPSQSESEIAECVGTINLSEIDGPSTLGDFKLHCWASDDVCDCRVCRGRKSQ